jgi:hypothetical protein
MSAEDWTVREDAEDDLAWLASSLALACNLNSYFHGVDHSLIRAMADRLVSLRHPWLIRLAATADEGDPAGWVIYQEIPTLTIAMAYVEPTYRGLGAWRALRSAIGLKDGQLVNVVLASPQAMGLARKKYQAKHNWGRCLEWLT